MPESFCEWAEVGELPPVEVYEAQAAEALADSEPRARSSAGERPPDAREVAGSIPAAPIDELVDDADVEILEPERPDVAPQPFHGVRGDAPGPKGCWAITRAGSPCGAAALHGGDFCFAHAGAGGVAADPAKYSPVAHAARREHIAERARMRLALGLTRSTGPRAVLRAKAIAGSERLAAAAYDAALDNGALALKLIREVDPPLEATVSVSLPTSEDEIDKLTLRELELLEARGLIGDPQPAPLALDPQSQA